MSKSQSDHPGQISSIGVVGAGTMGTGIAYVAALAGCAVSVVESTPAATQKMWAALADAVESGVKKGRITGSDSSLLVSRISALTNIDELPASLDIVIETVPEDLPLKIDVLTQIERRSPKVIASNTSALSIDELGSSINEPGRFLGMHFFNPVWSIKLIELVIGKDTGQAAVDAAIEFSRQTGKEHLLVKDHPGFATSRLDLIASLEAIRMLEAGVASATDIDRAAELAYGHPVGPLRLTDIVGLDVRLDIARALEKSLGSRFAPPGLLIDMVNKDSEAHHAELKDAVARLTGKYGRKYFQEVVAKGLQPVELWAELGSAGFLGAHISERYGGAGGGLSDLYIVIEETAAQGCPMLSLVISSICAPIIERYGSDDMKEEWLTGMANGSKRIAFAITEPDAGSNTHKVTTTAREEPDGWVINGSKYWTSAIDESDAVMVVARDDERSTAERSALSLFIVRTDTPGLSWQPIEAALQSNDKQFMSFYDEVRIPHEALVGEPGLGLQQVFVGLNPERVAAAGINNGIARFALEKASQYALDRQVWKSPIGAHQGVAHPLAEAYVGVQSARLMAAKAAQLFDSGEDA
ncbi:MAG: hypothetical protein EBU28_10845, partial [Gammaproteobacteria bacterium]|nr:hypothetical protein [Gammaproteobacteria bacterium]